MEKAVFRKFLFLALILGLVMVSGVFAAGDDAFGIGSRVKILVDVISSPWVKGIAAIALVVECIVLITSGASNQGIVKKFIPWIIGTILFMAAGAITTQFIDTESNSLKELSGSLTQ